MKKYLALVLAVLMALTCFALVACDKCKDGHTFENGVCTVCGEKEPAGGHVYYNEEFKGSAVVGATTKVYLTSFGQADFDFAEILLTDTEAGVGYTGATSNSLLEASAVEEGSVVIALVGYTAKGIAPGITIQGETERAQEFAALAEQNIITLVILHTGGEGRRGNASDPMLEAVVGVADYTFVFHDRDDATNGGDFDGKFTEWNKSELYLYASELDMVPALKVLLGL